MTNKNQSTDIEVENPDTVVSETDKPAPEIMLTNRFIVKMDKIPSYVFKSVSIPEFEKSSSGGQKFLTSKKELILSFLETGDILKQMQETTRTFNSKEVEIFFLNSVGRALFKIIFRGCSLEKVKLNPSAFSYEEPGEPLEVFASFSFFAVVFEAV